MHVDRRQEVLPHTLLEGHGLHLGVLVRNVLDDLLALLLAKSVPFGSATGLLATCPPDASFYYPGNARPALSDAPQFTYKGQRFLE